MTLSEATAAPSRGRVLLLGMGWSQPAGLDRFLTDLHGALRDVGVDAHAVVFGSIESLPPTVVQAGDGRTPLPVRLLRHWRVVARQAPEADIVDSHFALYTLLPVVLGTLRGTPLVVHFQGPWADESVAAGQRSRMAVALKRCVEFTVYRRADEIVVLSGAFRRLLVERYRVAPWRVHVIPPGVDLERFAPGPRKEARNVVSVGADDWVACTVRRLTPRMGIEVLLESWVSVSQAASDAVLLVAGDGPARSFLVEYAAKLGHGRDVRFLGRLSDEELVTCYRAADVCVVPSSTLEGFGLVVLESLATGTPVIVSDAGGLPEAVAGLDPSLIVPSGKADALATRLSGARTGSLPLPEPERCRDYATGFGWHEIARRTSEVYEQARVPATSRALRVVYLDHCAQLSGGEIALLRLLPALGEVDAHVILAEDGELLRLLTRSGISSELLAMDEGARDFKRDRVRPRIAPLLAGARLVPYVVRLAARLRRYRPDIVHTNSLKAAVYGSAAAGLAGVPCVLHVRDRIAADYLPAPAAAAVRLIGRTLPAGVIANSEATLLTLGPLRPGRHIPRRVIHDPVPVPGPHQARREDTTLRIGIVGRLAPWKGQDIFLKAFAEAFPTGTEQAILVGGPTFGEVAYERTLHQLASDLNLDKRVQFTGHVSDVAAALGQFDILVHASVIPEPFGLVVVEAMAAGVPVVAAGAGGPAEVVSNGVDGFLYPPGDVRALASTLRRLARDPELRARTGAAGRARAPEFAASALAAKVMAFYSEVLDTDALSKGCGKGPPVIGDSLRRDSRKRSR